MSDEQPVRSRPRAERRGEVFWRGVRYMVAICAGYLLGLSAGSMGGNGPGWPVTVAVSLVALVLIFRQGRKSVSHAAADAISRANARAESHATAANQITVAGGHVVTGAGAPTFGVVDEAARYVELPDGRVMRMVETADVVDSFEVDEVQEGSWVQR